MQLMPCLLVLLGALASAVSAAKKYGLNSPLEISHEDRLLQELLARYKRRGRFGRPVKVYNDRVRVRFNMQLIQIMDLDEKNQVLTLNVWDRYMWFDEYLTWNPEDYGGILKVRLPAKKIWTPDIKLYNYADTRLDEHRDALCVIKYTGEILWMPQAVYRSSCDINVTAFPFDVQQCNLKFGSWTYDGNKLDLSLLAANDTSANAGEIDLSEYYKSNAWIILRAPAVRHEVTYTCCPEPFIDLTFSLIFRRRSTFYNYILILPCILLTSLTLVLFWIPPESPAKLMLGINIFVAFFLLLLLMEANLPPAAASVPLLGTYYCLNMILITLSSFLNAFVVNLSFYGARRPVPSCLRQVLFNFFARVLCMDNLVRPFMAPTRPSQEAINTRFVGVNGEKKWSQDANSSSDYLLHVKKSPLDEHSDQLTLINFHLSELMDFIKQYRDRLSDKDYKEKMSKEWKALGLIFDRIFFLIYVTTIIVSMCVILPLLTMDHEPMNNPPGK